MREKGTCTESGRAPFHSPTSTSYQRNQQDSAVRKMADKNVDVVDVLAAFVLYENGEDCCDEERGHNRRRVLYPSRMRVLDILQCREVNYTTK